MLLLYFIAFWRISDGRFFGVLGNKLVINIRANDKVSDFSDLEPSEDWF